MKILILTAFFPPKNSIASLRPYSWAKYWSRSGHDVTVITTTKRQAPEDLSLPCTGFRVIELPVPLIEGVKKVKKLFSKKSSVSRESGGIVQAGTLPIFRPTSALFRRQIRYFQKKTGCLYGCRMPDALDSWIFGALRLAKQSNWDLVVSSAWPYNVHIPAMLLKKKGRANFWIADWRDLWVDNHIYPGLVFFRPFERMLEKKICLRADALTTVSQPLADTLAENYKREVQVVYNGFDEDDFSDIYQAKPDPDKGDYGPKKIVYTGTIYPHWRDPSPLFRAIKKLAENNRLSPDQLRVVFCGNNANVSILAEQEQVSDFVEYSGFLPRPEALAMQKNADALLFLEFDTKQLKGILTGKLFEYLNAGPPILAVGIHDDSGPGEIIAKLQAGICCGNNIEMIKHAVLDLVDGRGFSPKDSPLSAQQRTELLQFYSRRTQAERMLEMVVGNNA